MSNITTVSTSKSYLLDPQFLRRLEQAAIVSRRIFVGRTKGERRSARRGTSVEFADFRAYTPGDDLRYLDWNAYARLERLFLKLFIEEEDLHVYILLDTSRSMDFSSPTKFEWSVRAAAALAYLALCSGDRVQLFAHAESRGDSSRMFRGRGCAPELFDWLALLKPSMGTELSSAARWLLTSVPAPGITFVISDLLSPDWQPALARLAAGRGECCVLQVFSPEEFEPKVQGDLKLVDSETQEAREVTMGASVLRRYLRERDAFLEEVHKTCNRYGFSHIFVVTDKPVEDVILKSLRQLQVVK
jgi:uncharacterized protein (DUF58 family)